MLIQLKRCAAVLCKPYSEQQQYSEFFGVASSRVEGRAVAELLSTENSLRGRVVGPPRPKLSFKSAVIG